MSDLPEGRYAMIQVSVVGDKKIINAFERIDDYYEYMTVQTQLEEERKQSYFNSFTKPEGELN